MYAPDGAPRRAGPRTMIAGEEVTGCALRDDAAVEKQGAAVGIPGTEGLSLIHICAGRPDHSAIDETTRTAEEHGPWQGADGTTISGGEEA